jgi:hypothetical protein
MRGSGPPVIQAMRSRHLRQSPRSGGGKAGAVEFGDCLTGRRGHADELAIPVRTQCHVAPAPGPASLLNEPVAAVKLGNLFQQPVADLGVQRDLDPPVGLGFPRSRQYTANANGVATSLLASPAMRRTKVLRIAS